MALVTSYSVEKNRNSMAGLSAYENGGKGSGNFGHAGRPGEVGGSAPSGSGSSSTSSESGRKSRSKEEQIDEQFEKGNITESERDELKAQAKEARKTPGGQDAMKWARENKEIYDRSKLKEDEMSFDDILRSMYDGQDFYQTTGIQDSIDREVFFDEISKRTGLDYSDVYATWLFGSRVDLAPSNANYESDTKSIKKVAKYLKGLRKKNSLEEILTDTIMKILNGGKGSGNFNHDGRPGEVGGSAPSGSGGGSVGKKSKESRTRDAIAKAIASQKKLQDQAKVVREDIEDRIGQKMKEGEEYTALDEAHKSRFKVFHGEDGTEYTYDKENGMITKTNPKTGEEEVVTKQGKDQTSSNEKKQKPLYDDGNLGTAPLIAVKDNGKYKAKSFASEEDTRKLLEADGDLKKVASLAYDKSIKSEKPTEAQQKVFQQITGIRRLLEQKVGEMGDNMTFIDKKMDWDNYDAVMDHTAEFLTKARLAAMGDKSKIGGKLNEAISTLSNVRDRIVDLGSPDRLNRGGEPSWYDIDDMVERRKR